MNAKTERDPAANAFLIFAVFSLGLIALARPCFASVVFSDDFESGMLSGWTVSVPAGTSAAASAGAARSGGYGLALSDTSADQSASAGRIFTVQNGTLTLEIDVSMSNDALPNYFSVDLKSGVSLLGPRVRFYGKDIQYCNGGSWASAQEFSTGVWYRFTIVANIAAGMYDFFVNGVKRATGAAFASAGVATIDRVSIVSSMYNAAPTGTLHADNLVITDTPPAAPDSPLMFHYTNAADGVISGFDQIAWNGTVVASGEFCGKLSLKVGAQTFDTFRVVSSGTVAGGGYRVVLSSGATDSAPGVEMEMAPADEVRAGVSWQGFRYRHRVVNIGTAAAELVESRRWRHEGTSASPAYWIRSAYQAAEYVVGQSDGFAPPSGAVQSRFGKTVPFDFHEGNGKAMLVFPETAELVINNTAAARGETPTVEDRYLFAGGADGTHTTAWKRVLWTAAWPSEKFARINAFNTLWFGLRTYYRQAAQLADAPPTLPAIVLGPRMDLVEAALPKAKALGFKRISLGPVWTSSASEGGGRSSMSVYDYTVASSLGGIGRLTQFCATARAAGIDVLAWLPAFHWSDQSPQLAAHPEWRAASVGQGLFEGQLLPLDSGNAIFRARLLDQLAAVRQAGLSGFWLDSFHNFAVETRDAVSQEPRLPDVLSLVRAVEQQGFTLYAEALTPYAIASCGMLENRIQYYRGAEYRMPEASLYIGEELNGTDLSLIDYFAHLAFGSPLLMYANIWPGKTAFANFSAQQQDDLARWHAQYEKARPDMKNLTGYVLEGRAVLWEGGCAPILFALEDCRIREQSGLALASLRTGEALVAGAGRFSLERGTVYKLTRATGASVPALLQLVANESAPPVIAIPEAVNLVGRVGGAFSFKIAADNLPASYSASGLPAGLSINSTTGVISGTPAYSGIFAVTLGAVNSYGAGSATVSIVIGGDTRLDTVVVATAGLVSPTSAVFDAAGNLYVVDVGAGAVKKIAAGGGVSVFASVPGASCLAIDPAGVFFAGCSDGSVKKVLVNGTVSPLALATGQGAVGGIAVGADGAVYISIPDANVIKKITPSGAVTPLVAAGAGLASPTGLAFNFATGKLYAADTANDRIVAIDTHTGAVTVAVGATTGMDTPEALAVDAAGLVYIADTGNHVVRVFDPVSENILTAAGEPGEYGNIDGGAGAATLNGPAGIAINATGHIYIIDTNNKSVRLLTAGPVSIAPLADRTVITGSGATFDGSVWASPAATYQWYKNSGLISGATKATYTIVSAQNADAGEYMIIASNTLGKSLDSLRLTLTSTPPPSGGGGDAGGRGGGGGAVSGWLLGALALLVCARRIKAIP